MKSRIVLGICVALLLAGSLSADTKFTGAVDDMWSNPDNWSAGLPDPADKIQINGDTLCILDYDAGVIKNTSLEGGGKTHLQLVDGAVLSVAEWTIIGYAGNPEEPHTLEVLGGVYNGGHPDTPNNGRIYVGRAGYALLIIDHSGRVNLLHQDIQVGQGDGGNGTIELRGGLLDCGTRRLILQPSATATAHVDFSGGVLKERYSVANLAEINGWIDSGMITAYDGAGTVVVDSVDENNDATLDTLVVKGLHPLTPGPEDGSSIVPGSVTLSWTLPDPCVPGQPVPVDVYFTDNLQALKDFIDPAAIRIASKQTLTSKTIPIQPKTRYYWAVDTYQGTDHDPVWGPIFEFYVDNLAPEVKTDSDVTTWIDDVSVDVSIGGLVTDADATTVAWTVVSEPSPGAAVLANASQISTTVSLSSVGTYVLQLEADDGEKQGADTLTINVYANSCLAAQSLPDYVPLVGDLDQDCDVDQDDLDLLMANWLECVALGDCDPNGL
ncbi:MAG: hypothetical protein K9N55_20255 [Phycisphaerae bacterium]|nr:hypothetical protein [Phycisphaerae bacterium]